MIFLDETTVALLLDYAYNTSRKIASNINKWDYRNKSNYIKFVKFKFYSKILYFSYCVEYKLDWVNRNCIEPKWKSKLFRNNKICAECQPEAQFHRNTRRYIKKLF